MGIHFNNKKPIQLLRVRETTSKITKTQNNELTISSLNDQKFHGRRI